jgi:Predicted membrane protein
MNNKAKYITEVAVIAGLYATLTIIFMPISYGQIQVRISEVLTILPFFTTAAIPGLFIGCIVANFFGGIGIIDIVFGSLATLLAAFLTYKMPKKILAPLPPVIVNGVIVGFELYFISGAPLVATILWVGLGEALACYALGYPVLLQLERYKHRLFKR